MNSMEVQGIRIKPGEHVTTMGIVGSGKTYFNRNGLLPTSYRAVILDSEEDDYQDFPHVDVKHALRLAKSDYEFFCHIPTKGDRDFDEPVLEELCAGLLTKPYGHDFTFLIEEATDYSDASYIPPYLHAIMRRARHHKISVIVSTQRPARMSKDYYSLSKHHFFFALDDFDVERTDYAKFLAEHAAEIPDGSYRCIYKRSGAAPDDITILAPVAKYDWAARLRRMRQ
jgi:hypothetical protein